MAEADALQEFVRESIAQSQTHDSIRKVLLEHGWQEHQVDEALHCYETTASGIPVPSPRTRYRPNAWFFTGTSTFAGEVFQIVEWLAVMVGVRYAAIRTHSVTLDVLFVALLLLLAAHMVGSWVRFEWWLWPNLDRSSMKGLRAIVRMLVTLSVVYGLYLFVMDVTTKLLQVQIAVLPAT
jgi:hypothetical protein